MSRNSPSPHKTRKRKTKPTVRESQTTNTHDESLGKDVEAPALPIEAFLWPARAGTSRWVLLPLVFMTSSLFRWAAGLWGYSGFQSPPMHGDFEAQRHWMEITIWLPISQWYFHDLEWWGLDYPPLTAYHSWLLGKFGSLFNGNWFTLYSSRGLDDPHLKIYMRATVLASDLIVYIPAVTYFCFKIGQLRHVATWQTLIALVAILMQPSTLLIDHAHFQYNTVMLGFTVWTIAALTNGSFLWSSVAFVAALGFKQMALYYAPVVFAFLLGSCLFPAFNFRRFLAIASVTALSFAVLFAPLGLGSAYDAYRGISPQRRELPEMFTHININHKSLVGAPLAQIAQCIHRVFPFARGLFEDKVANFWCAIHTFYKLHGFSKAVLQRASLLATAAAIVPPSVIAFLNPTPTSLLPALAASAWGFFLFSFQVHEKSVLLPLLPMTLMLAEAHGFDAKVRSWVVFANTLGAWTMFPLLKRDELRVPYFVLTSLWTWLMGLNETYRLKSSKGLYEKGSKILHGGFYCAMVAWHLAEALFTPPHSKPDLWTVANVLIGAAGFALCYIWCLIMLLQPYIQKSNRQQEKKKTS